MEAAGIEPAARSFWRERSDLVERSSRRTSRHGTPRAGLAKLCGYSSIACAPARCGWGGAGGNARVGVPAKAAGGAGAVRGGEGQPGLIAGGRPQDANGKNPIRFSLHRRIIRRSRRPSASHVGAQPGDLCPQPPRPSAKRDGPACLESEVEGVPDPGRRAAAEQGRAVTAGGSPERLVGTREGPRGRIVQPAAKGPAGRPGGGP
jgi:hypothetical protein